MKYQLPLKNYHNKLLNDLADKIIEYYPIGVKIDSPEYDQHTGVKELWELMNDNIANARNYKDRWLSFISKVRKDAKKRVHSTTYGYVPGYSAELILERWQDDRMIHVKKLLFSVSLLGPYYSICGVDETTIKDEYRGALIGYSAINVLTVSPYKEFEKHFSILEASIKNQFPNYKIVPLRLGLSFIENLQVPFGNRDDCTFYNALFSNILDYYNNGTLRGDSFYGFEGQDAVTVTLVPSAPL